MRVSQRKKPRRMFLTNLLIICSILVFLPCESVAPASYNVYCLSDTCAGTPQQSDIPIPAIGSCVASLDVCMENSTFFETWIVDASGTHYTQRVFASDNCSGTPLLENNCACQECGQVALPVNSSMFCNCSNVTETPAPTRRTAAPTADVLLTIGMRMISRSNEEGDSIAHVRCLSTLGRPASAMRLCPQWYARN